MVAVMVTMVVTVPMVMMVVIIMMGSIVVAVVAWNVETMFKRPAAPRDAEPDIGAG